MTKPIIFTYLLLSASRHVILNGLGDPWADFEPLENMVSQKKLSQETACVRQQAFQMLLTCHLVERYFGNLKNPYFLKEKQNSSAVSILSNAICVIACSSVLKTKITLYSAPVYENGACVSETDGISVLSERAGWNFSSAAKHGELDGEMLFQFKDRVKQTDRKLHDRVSLGYCYK